MSEFFACIYILIYIDKNLTFLKMLIKFFLRPLLINLIINSLALYGVSYLLPGRLIITGGLAAYLIAGLIIGFLNFGIKPVLHLLSIPFIVASLGLFLILINGFIIYLTEFILNFLTGESINMVIDGGFFSYVIIALIFGVLNYLISIVLRK
jgi:putative membrane protein